MTAVIFAGRLIDIRMALAAGDVTRAVNLVRNTAIADRWSQHLSTAELEALTRAGWEGGKG